MNKGKTVLIATSLNLGLFSVFTGIGLINAMLVDLGLHFGKTVSAMGQLAAVAAISWAVFAFFLGPFSDRIGHRTMIIIGMIIFIGSLVLFGLSASFPTLMIAGVLSGLGGAFAGPNVLTAVGDYFPARIVGLMLAFVTVSTPMANFLGVPVLVFIGGHLGWRASFFALALISFISIFPLLFVEKVGPYEKKSLQEDVSYSKCMIDVMRSKSFRKIIVANTLMQIAYWLLATYFAAFIIRNYHVSSDHLALYLSIMSVGQIFGTLTGGPLADRCDRLKVGLVFGLLLGLSGIIFIHITNSIFLNLVMGTLFMGTYAIGRPAFFAFMLTTSEVSKGTIMGMQATSNHVGRAIGAAIGGLVLSVSSYSIMGFLCLLFSIINVFIYLSIIRNRCVNTKEMTSQY